MKKIGGIAFAGALVVVAIVVLTSGGDSGGPEQDASLPLATHEFDAFPLWREVRGHPFVRLGEGKLPNGTRWAAYASKTGAGRSGRENPTLTVAGITAFGGINKGLAGGPLTPVREGWSPVTAMFSSAGPLSGQAEGETFMAMSFKPYIASIRITFASGDEIRWRTHLLNRVQQHKAHLPPLRYVALGWGRKLCIAKVVGYGLDGEFAFEGRFKNCQPSPHAYSEFQARLGRDNRKGKSSPPTPE